MSKQLLPWLVATTVACSGAPQTGEKTTENTSAPSCAERAAALGAFVDELDRIQPGAEVPAYVTLAPVPASTAWQRVPAGTVVALYPQDGATKLRIGRAEYGMNDGVARVAQRLCDPGLADEPLIIAASNEASWEELALVIDLGVEAGLDAVHLVLERALASEVADAEESLSSEGGDLEATYDPCPQASPALAMDARGGERGAALADALQRCDCAIDLRRAKALHLQRAGLAGRDGKAPVVVRLPLHDDSGTATPLALAADTAWAAASAQVLAALETGRTAYAPFTTLDEERDRIPRSRPDRKDACSGGELARRVARNQHVEELREVGFLGALKSEGPGAFSGISGGDVGELGGLLGDDPDEGGFGTGGLGLAPAKVPQVQLGTAQVGPALDKEIIRRVIRSNLPRIKFCYEKELLVNPQLAGKVTVEFTIGSDGAVSSAKATGLHPDVAECVQRAVAAMVFPRPQGGGTVKVSYPFVFQSAQPPAGTIGIGQVGTIGKGSGTGKGSGYGTGSIGAKPPAVQVRIGNAKVDGPLDKAIVRRFVRRRLSWIKFCYSHALERNPKLAGTVTTEFTIGADGKVSASAATGVDAELSGCVAKGIEGITFPRPKDGGTVRVRYPFQFSRP